MIKNEQDTIIYKKLRKPSPAGFRVIKTSPTVLSLKRSSLPNGDCLMSSEPKTVLLYDSSSFNQNRSISEPRIHANYRHTMHKSFPVGSQTTTDSTKRSFHAPRSLKRSTVRNFERNQTISIAPNYWVGGGCSKTSSSGGGGNSSFNAGNNIRPRQISIMPSHFQLSSKPMVRKVSDRRTMYARSKLSVRRLNITGEQNSPEVETKATTTTTTNVVANESTKLLSPIVMTRRDHKEQLLDPNWIPLRVRTSLLDMHYHLHKKPQVLQTSHFSKSDSNIKGTRFFEKSKKLLSLQKSSYE